MSKYILALDQGTTSSKSVLFNKNGEIICQKNQEFTQIFPQQGWVEHNPYEIWLSQINTAQFVINTCNIRKNEIAAIGITNQRETTILWNKETGAPIYNAIVWQDRRTANYCDELKLKGLESKILKKTGLVIDAYFSATKIKWILDNIPIAKSLLNENKLAFGTIDSWLIWNLTNGKLHVTDSSNASRTLLFNLYTNNWDEELAKIFNIPMSILPKIIPSSGIIGEVEIDGLLKGVKIASVAGDQQAATFGNLCIKKGMVKNTYGTGCFLLMNIGNEIKISNNNLVTTYGWHIKNSKIDVHNYCMEGSVFIGGAITQWLRDQLHFIRKSSEIEELASKVFDNGGAYIVPAFAGLGAPYWDQYARGAIFGLTRGTSDAHLARAAIEAIAYQVFDLVNALTIDTKENIKCIRVDGAACSNNLLMQFQADILNTVIERPKCLESTSLGVAFLAGIATNFWSSIDELEYIWKLDRRFEPNMSNAKRDELIFNWHKAVKRTRNWVLQNE